jgi:hypothetical protein
MIDRLPQTPIDTPGNAALQSHAHPQDVVADNMLTTIEKRQILNEWAESARARRRAGDHTGEGGANMDLAEIERALNRLESI